MADEDQNKREGHEEDSRAPDQDLHVRRRKRIGRLVGITIMAATVLVGILVWQKMTLNPRTQDASVGAYYIGMAPRSRGPGDCAACSG